MNKKHLLELVVRPTLKGLGLHTVAAEQLVMGTITQESHAEYLKQLGQGPALGIAQMEPATHRDIWLNYIAYRKDLKVLLVGIMSGEARQTLAAKGVPPDCELIGNLPYAVAMCRVHYLRVKESLPAAGDVDGLARYWKRHYNTAQGAGTEAEFVRNYPADLFR